MKMETQIHISGHLKFLNAEAEHLDGIEAAMGRILQDGYPEVMVEAFRSFLDIQNVKALSSRYFFSFLVLL